MRHVLSALVHNQPGELAHISGMLASRGFNIDSLAVAKCERPRMSRMIFVVNGDDNVLDQVRKHWQLYVLLFLGVLFVFAYWMKREYWKDVH